MDEDCQVCIFLPSHSIFSILSKKPLSLAVIKDWWGKTKISKPILHTHFKSPLFYQLPDKFLAFALNNLMELQLSGTKLRFVILFFHPDNFLSVPTTVYKPSLVRRRGIKSTTSFFWSIQSLTRISFKFFSMVIMIKNWRRKLWWNFMSIFFFSFF
jgi:hypothetical protein